MDRKKIAIVTAVVTAICTVWFFSTHTVLLRSSKQVNLSASFVGEASAYETANSYLVSIEPFGLVEVSKSGNTVRIPNNSSVRTLGPIAFAKRERPGVNGEDSVKLSRPVRCKVESDHISVFEGASF